MNLYRNKCPNDEQGSFFKSNDMCLKLGHPDPSGGSNFLPITRLRWIEVATGGDLVLSSSCLWAAHSFYLSTLALGSWQIHSDLCWTCCSHLFTPICETWTIILTFQHFLKRTRPILTHYSQAHALSYHCCVGYTARVPMERRTKSSRLEGQPARDRGPEGP